MEAEGPLRPAQEKVHIAATFPAQPAQIGAMRAYLRHVLADCPARDDAVLAASELTTNATLHSRSREPGGVFTLRVMVQPGEHVRIEVADQGGPWVYREPDSERPHGLEILDCLVGHGNWGVDGDDDIGHVVWVRLDY